MSYEMRVQSETRVFHINRVHDVSVVQVAGDLSRYNIRNLEEVLKSCSRCGQLNIILNFESLQHIDYQLVRRLADHIVTFQCEGGDIKLANVNSYVQNILRVMGLEEEEFFPSVEEALLTFFEKQPNDELQ